MFRALVVGPGGPCDPFFDPWDCPTGPCDPFLDPFCGGCDDPFDPSCGGGFFPGGGGGGGGRIERPRPFPWPSIPVGFFSDLPSPDPHWPISWCDCELTGPREPLLTICLYQCECTDSIHDATVAFPMGGLLGLKNMCGAMLSCPKRVFAIRANLFGNFGVYGAYACEL
jgi:hypothetical protein